MSEGATTLPATAPTTITTTTITTTTNYDELAKMKTTAVEAIVWDDADGWSDSERLTRTDTGPSACGPFPAQLLLSLSGI